MKYRNIETGVILEPATLEAEASLKKDERYVAVRGKPPELPTPPKPPTPETETETEG